MGVSREINLGGRHFAAGRLNGDGVHYWDRREYNEQSIHLAAGYKNRSVTRSFGILPFIEYNRLGGEPYNQVFGAQADFSGRLNDKWRIALNAGHIWKRYREERTAARYDGHMPSAGATLIYAAPKNWLLFGGADWSHDITRETEQASVRKGVRLGVFKTFSDGLGLRANLRYSRRVFDAPGTLVYRFVRKDREYQADASVWHEKLSWKGLVPRLNLQYLKVDSNMGGFYSRRNMQWFVSMEKLF